MANTITKHVMVNGTRNLLMEVVIDADGTGDYSAFPIIDVTEYETEDEPREPVTDIKVKKLHGRQGTGTSFSLLFGSDTENNRKFFDSSDNTDDFSSDWSEMGGITSQVADTDKTIRITTGGFDASGDVISFFIWIQKKR